MQVTLSKALYLASLVLLIIAAVLCFIGSDISTLHVLGFIACGLACMAAAAVAG